MTETVRKACLEVARNHPRPQTRETIAGGLTCTGKVGREVADLFAAMNAQTNRDEVRFWSTMVVRYGG